MREIQQILAKEIEGGKSPSVQYYLFDKDNIIESFQLGFSDILNQKNVDTDTTYNSYSVTKTFTALAILQLAEKGKIDINNRAGQYLPGFHYGDEITIKQLMSHTAGIPNPIPLSWVHLETENSTFNRDDFFRAVFGHHRKARSKPGEKFAYSNLGYVILGQIIEKVTGKTYEEYVTENIIRKFTTESGDLTFTLTDNENHAKGYHKRLSFTSLVLGFLIDKPKFMGRPEGRWRPFRNFYTNGVSYGGLIGRPAAFVKYIRELLNENSSLISGDYKKLLFQENKNNKGQNTGMCLGWFSGDLNGNKYFTHAGGGGGYYCEIRIYPDIKTGSVIFFSTVLE